MCEKQQHSQINSKCLIDSRSKRFLDIVNNVISNTKELVCSPLLMHIDNKKIWEEVIKQGAKASAVSSDTIVIISEI